MDKLQEILEKAGVECRSYSGRAMYGNYCLGVVVRDVKSLFVTLLDSIEDIEDVDPIRKAFRSMRTDNMGHDTICYFPGVPYEEDNEDEEEDSEED